MKQLCKEIYQNSKYNNLEIIKLIRRSYSKDHDIRYFSIRNNTPLSVLIRLSDDKDDMVRSSVARHSDTPLYILIKLIQDKDSIVREHTIRNPTYKKYVKYRFFTRIKNWFIID